MLTGMCPKSSDDPQPVAATAQSTLPRLLAQSRDFARLDALLKQRLDQIPADAYRVACLRHGELSLFCSQSVWLARLRMMQSDILSACRELYTEGVLKEWVTSVKIRMKADPAERFG